LQRSTIAAFVRQGRPAAGEPSAGELLRVVRRHPGAASAATARATQVARVPGRWNDRLLQRLTIAAFVRPSRPAAGEPSAGELLRVVRRHPRSRFGGDGRATQSRGAGQMERPVAIGLQGFPLAEQGRPVAGEPSAGELLRAVRRHPRAASAATARATQVARVPADGTTGCCSARQSPLSSTKAGQRPAEPSAGELLRVVRRQLAGKHFAC